MTSITTELVMNEMEIAISKAEILDRLSNWRRHSTFDGSYDPRTKLATLGEEELQLARLEGMTVKLATSHALATKKDFKTALMEVELQISIYLAKLLEPTLDPVLAGTTTLKVEKDGTVCGVCQEEMQKGDEARAMQCMHMFHDSCILKWLKLKINNTCPLCRTTCRPKKLHFQDFKT